jgi:hypothetical protein
MCLWSEESCEELEGSYGECIMTSQDFGLSSWEDLPWAEAVKGDLEVGKIKSSFWGWCVY